MTKAESLRKLCELLAVRRLAMIEPSETGAIAAPFGKWRQDVETALRYVFGPDPGVTSEFRKLTQVPWVSCPSGGSHDAPPYDRACVRAWERAEEYLRSKKAEIEDYWPEDPDGAGATGLGAGSLDGPTVGSEGTNMRLDELNELEKKCLLLLAEARRKGDAKLTQGFNTEPLAHELRVDTRECDLLLETMQLIGAVKPGPRAKNDGRYMCFGIHPRIEELARHLERQQASESEDETSQTDTAGGPNVNLSQNEPKFRGKDVFIVHGHDAGMKDTVARFVEKLGLRPIILHEQADRGRTIIEKFEAHAGSATYAIAMATGDDVGAPACEVTEELNRLTPRARQNVILELGFFLGKLGRERVCCLYQEGVELPSDLHGVLYVPISEGDWQRRVAKEMQAAGLKIVAENLLC